jgi:hypothetical protein
VEFSVSVEIVQGIRDRVLPMLRYVADEYRERVPEGYPVIIDTPDRGVVGIELDPNYSLYFATDGRQAYAEMFYRAPRTDARSSASREKFGGMPFSDRRPLDPGISDQGLRNFISELMSRWNFQPLIIHITDTD